jgi:hypothetical protein
MEPMNNFNKIIDEFDSNESESDIEGNQSEGNDKEGNADTEDEEEDCEEVKLTNFEQIRSMNKSKNEKYIKDTKDGNEKNNEVYTMSSYELKRAANIAKNNEFMKTLLDGKDSLMPMLMKENVKERKPRAKKVKFADDTKDVRRKSTRIKEKSVAAPKKTAETIKSQKETTSTTAIDSPLIFKNKANEGNYTAEFDLITVHTFNKFVAEINDEELETKLMQLTNEET